MSASAQVGQCKEVATETRVPTVIRGCHETGHVKHSRYRESLEGAYPNFWGRTVCQRKIVTDRCRMQAVRTQYNCESS